MNDSYPSPPVAAPAVDAPTGVLREIVRRHGTPTYAYDLDRIRGQVAKLRTHLPPEVEILYSLKANASLGLCGVLADWGLGADVASAGELATALAAGFVPARTFLTGPDKSPAVLTALTSLPEVVVSLDSVSELELLSVNEPTRWPGAEGSTAPRERRKALLRLRPDFCSRATCSAGPDSRFGLTPEDLPRVRELLGSPAVDVVGFHVFSGSQVLSTEGVVDHLRSGVDLALRAADGLGIAPQLIDVGGGFGTPYGPDDAELDLAAIGRELERLVRRADPARLVIELGRYLVAEAGWYLTSVLAEQTHRGRRAVVVDGGSHQRADVCGVGLRHRALPPVVLGEAPGPLTPTDVLGCLSLPADVLAESCPLPPLVRGDVLAFPNAGAYGLSAAPCLFHAHVPPAEAAFEEGRLHLLRARRSVESVLEGQTPLTLERTQSSALQR